MAVLNDPFLVRLILLYADYDTIINYGRTCLQGEGICRDKVFWMNKAQKNFYINLNNFKDTDLSPALRYLELLTQNGGVAMGSEDFVHLNKFVKRAIRQDRNDLVQYAINLGFDDWDITTYEYAMKGDKEAVNYYLKLSKDYNLAAQGALEGNHKELFNYIYSSQLNYDWDFNGLIASAIDSKNLQLFYYVKSLGPMNYDWDFDELASAAVESGSQELFDYILSLASSGHDWNFSDLTSIAIMAQSLSFDKFFNHICSLAPNYRWNYNTLAIAAVRSGNQILFNYIQSLTPLEHKWNYYALALHTIKSGNVKLFDYIQSLIPPEYLLTFDSFAERALGYGDKEFFGHILSLVPDYRWNLNDLAASVAYSGNLRLFNYLLSIASEYSWDFNLITRSALSSDDKRMFDHVRSLAPPHYCWNYNGLCSKTIGPIENERLFIHVHSLAPSDYPWDYKRLIEEAKQFGNKKLTEYIRYLASTRNYS